MAFLCALLEQHPHSNSEPISHKYEVIKSFLENVVHVVPFESVLFAIANGSHDTAMSCIQALKSCQFDFTGSKLMFEGTSLAMFRLAFGITGHSLKQLEGKKVVKQALTAFTLKIEPNEVTITHYPRIPGQMQPSTSARFVDVVSMKREELEFLPVTEETRDAAKYLRSIQTLHSPAMDQQFLSGSLKLLCGLDIDTLYPITYNPQQEGNRAFWSPLSILSRGREELCALKVEQKAQEARRASGAVMPRERSKTNQIMHEVVNTIQRKEVDACISLLGAFMQQHEICIELARSKRGTVSTLDIKAAASVGVWALFSLDYSRVMPILAQRKGEQLLVMIEDDIKGMSGEAPEDSRYAAKLQFIVQGMRKTVTCNSQYVTYSLEQQLVGVCKERRINTTIPLDTLLNTWDALFKGSTLSLVSEVYRPLISRWIKWALMIHNLREELAKYTAIGVVGLVNSGKSKLVNTLFRIQV